MRRQQGRGCSIYEIVTLPTVRDGRDQMTSAPPHAPNFADRSLLSYVRVARAEIDGIALLDEVGHKTESRDFMPKVARLSWNRVLLRDADMRQVGKRREPVIELKASGHLLVGGARFNESFAQLSRTTFIPRGIHRFRSHEDANRHALQCLVRGMGLLAAQRR